MLTAAFLLTLFFGSLSMVVHWENRAKKEKKKKAKVIDLDITETFYHSSEN